MRYLNRNLTEFCIKFLQSYKWIYYSPHSNRSQFLFYSWNGTLLKKGWENVLRELQSNTHHWVIHKWHAQVISVMQKTNLLQHTEKSGTGLPVQSCLRANSKGNLQGFRYFANLSVKTRESIIQGPVLKAWTFLKVSERGSLRGSYSIEEAERLFFLHQNQEKYCYWMTGGCRGPMHLSNCRMLPSWRRAWITALG